ncbi:tRNA (cytidine(34)-2'-O)-methyltransferase [hydrothermal vent metagenome]|uniref:tRNA (Cytidine(34)-2'-O)-methyltransferase n=1 Tax=hydrothermal vent metagenome TaxID=652676 RepID=A0A3B0ZC39_9ZZZZ
MRRAGLDYHEFASIQEYDDLDSFIAKVQPTRLIACSTKGTRNHTEIEYGTDDALLFGPESRGLPAELLASLPKDQIVRIPMLAESRSLNLSNAVAIFLYEAWRQHGFQPMAARNGVL